MRRKITQLIPLTYAFLVTKAFAQAGVPNFSQYDSIEEVIIAIVSLLQPIVVFVFVGMVLYGGWNYLTSQGNEDKIKQAKQIIMAAIIGFIIIILAPSIVQLVAGIFGVNRDLVKV